MSENHDIEKHLLPCPFCGSKAVVERRGTMRASMQIGCENCGCKMESGDVAGLTEPAGYQWNKRLKARRA